MARYYNVDEANARVPELTAIFSAVMQLRVQLKRLFKRLETAGHAPSTESLDAALPAGTPATVARDRAVFKALVEQVSDSLREVEQLGASVKDVEIGLCDFLASREGREVLLCWKFGEAAVTHWHDLESGFAGRRPLTDEDRRSMAAPARAQQ
jgi:hypothetical protein